jgi:hypothetical protein
LADRAKALEPGCGSGPRHLEALARRGQVVGIDGPGHGVPSREGGAWKESTLPGEAVPDDMTDFDLQVASTAPSRDSDDSVPRPRDSVDIFVHGPASGGLRFLSLALYGPELP